MTKTTSPELVAAAVLAAMTDRTLHQRAELVKQSGSCLEALRQLPHARSHLDAARLRISVVQDHGFNALCWSDPDYPRLLKAAPDPPLVLFVWGKLEPEDALSIAVVGSRRATRYGLEMSRRLASELAQAGLVIVSGLARGIDQAAHLGALEQGERTIAVLGSGLHRLYPREHRKLAERIADNGAVVTELDLDEPPKGQNFPRRNRIITGMTLGTLVVEAALKSGSLVSARTALDQNREVFAVPGPARSPNSEGVHALLKDGATLVSRAADVLQELRADVRQLLETRPRRPSPQREDLPDPLDETEHAVLRALEHAGEPTGLDALVEGIGLTTPLALAALSRLEVKGLVWRLSGGAYQARPVHGW